MADCKDGEDEDMKKPPKHEEDPKCSRSGKRKRMPRPEWKGPKCSKDGGNESEDHFREPTPPLQENESQTFVQLPSSETSSQDYIRPDYQVRYRTNPCPTPPGLNQYYSDSSSSMRTWSQRSDAKSPDSDPDDPYAMQTHAEQGAFNRIEPSSLLETRSTFYERKPLPGESKGEYRRTLGNMALDCDLGHNNTQLIIFGRVITVYPERSARELDMISNALHRPAAEVVPMPMPMPSQPLRMSAVACGTQVRKRMRWKCPSESVGRSAFAGQGPSRYPRWETEEAAEIEALPVAIAGVSSEPQTEEVDEERASEGGGSVDSNVDVEAENAVKAARNKALLDAARKGDVPAMERLLANGADVECRNENGLTALHHASLWGNKRVAELLLHDGAKVDAVDYKGRTPLDFAASLNRWDVVELLLANGANFEWRDEDGRTALHHTSLWGNKRVAELLLRRGAKVDAVDNGGRTSLYFATSYGHRGVMELLLANGADVECRDEDGTTALHHASLWGNKRVAELLLRRGAKVDAVDYKGRTPLDFAASLNRWDAVELLLANGANFEWRDEDGRTALHHASLWGNKRVAELLLRRGADVNAVDNGGRTPLGLATSTPQWGVVELLRANGANGAGLDRFDENVEAPMHAVV